MSEWFEEKEAFKHRSYDFRKRKWYSRLRFHKISFAKIFWIVVIIFLILNYTQMLGLLNNTNIKESYRVYINKATIFPIRNESEIEMKIYELTNIERSEIGVFPLTYSPKLSGLAKSWSEKMLSEDLFEHSRLNVGENIGEVPISLIPFFIRVEGCMITLTNNQIASCHNYGWVGSAGHYANMISPSYTHIGVGVSCNIGECKATQMFS